MPFISNSITASRDKFPDDAIFTRLRDLAAQRPDVSFYDEYTGINSNYNDLIRDVIHLRKIIRSQLGEEAFNDDGTLRKQETCMGSLAWSGYYFIVAFLAITAIGGVCVPIPPESTKDEAKFFLNKANVECVLVESDLYEMAITFKTYIKRSASNQLSVIEISRAPAESASISAVLEINELSTFAPRMECFILYSSGTTGSPKGIVLPRKRFYFTEDPPAEKIVYLSSSPSHWVGGTGLVDGVLNGDNLHIMKPGHEPERFWNILRQGQITDMSLSPTVLRELAHYYKENISFLPPKQRDEFLTGARSLKLVYSSGSRLDAPTAQFLKELIDMPIRVAYGITEMGGGLMVTPQDCAFSDGYIGRAFPGISLKLSNGNTGEILVKTPHMFVRYLGDEKKTRDAFDADGWYKSGDCANLVGEDYFFKGRISYDWVRFHEYKISVQELEQHLTRLPYVREAHVIPVQDHDSGGLVAALVRVRKERTQTCKQGQEVTLKSIRSDLAARGLVSYKLPAMLRILQDIEPVPYTISGKALKREALRTYFNISGYIPSDYSHKSVEFWGNKLDMNTASGLEDWGGL